MRFRLSNYLTYRMDARVLLGSLCLSVLTLAVYWLFFDILAPSIPDGSVRSIFGPFFFVPILLLLSGQTLFATWLLHVSITTVAPDKKDALKAYFVSSVLVFLFSLYYLFFPSYGPYTFVVYFARSPDFGPTSYPILVAWTTAIVVGIFLLIKRTFRLENDAHFGIVRMLLLAATMLTIVMVMAS